MRSLLGEISSEMPVAYVGTGISLEISPADSRQQLTLSLCLGNKAVKYQFLLFFLSVAFRVCMYSQENNTTLYLKISQNIFALYTRFVLIFINQ